MCLQKCKWLFFTNVCYIRCIILQKKSRIKATTILASKSLIQESPGFILILEKPTVFLHFHPEKPSCILWDHFKLPVNRFFSHLPNLLSGLSACVPFRCCSKNHFLETDFKGASCNLRMAVCTALLKLHTLGACQLIGSEGVHSNEVSFFELWQLSTICCQVILRWVLTP